MTIKRFAKNTRLTRAHQSQISSVCLERDYQEIDVEGGLDTNVLIGIAFVELSLEAAKFDERVRVLKERISFLEKVAEIDDLEEREKKVKNFEAILKTKHDCLNIREKTLEHLFNKVLPNSHNEFLAILERSITTPNISRSSNATHYDKNYNQIGSSMISESESRFYEKTLVNENVNNQQSRSDSNPDDLPF